MPETPIRSVRVPDLLWQDAKAEASDRGESVSDPIVRALLSYTRERRKRRQTVSVAADTINPANQNGHTP